MNKKQFIEWLIIKFMSNADARLAEVALKDLESILPENIDFEYLRTSILTNYEKRIMPDFNFMKQYFRKVGNGDNKWTATTWDIFGKTRQGLVYAFANYMGVSEYEGREIFIKAHPELEYVGNNRNEILKRIYSKD